MNLHLEKMNIREILVSQLSFFDEQLKLLLDQYLPPTDDVRIQRERKNTKAFFERYMFKMEQYLSSHASDKEIPCPDFVFMGSTVTVQYVDTKQLVSYTLCMPEDSDPGNYRISIVSPLGFQLLMAAKGSQITIVTPGNIARVNIVDIQIAQPAER
ncbi:GreA/GreB family elongation factor [Paenibacillus dakarensis]|uniref:GreA/GreB family elongation factor n=1 Tax=Paenibacillus dakarensis TaxID=1527293 RepID=UPI0006D58D6B|nr:GreA/GreB family elongation factor [Paenibacillus dakarensis]